MAKKISGDAEKADQAQTCSFCGKKSDSKRRLVSGIGDVYICNQCAAVCDAELNEEANELLDEANNLLESLTNELTVLTYKSIEDDDYIRYADEVLPINFKSVMLLESVDEAFRRKGWAGDTDICAFWIPPFFCDKKREIGTVVWYAKDNEKRVSYLAFEKDGLDYVKNAKWLVEQNKEAFEKI